MTFSLENISKLMRDLRDRPGLMKMEELEEINTFIQSLHDHLSVFATCMPFEGTSLNEVKHYLERTEWYINYSRNK